MVHPRISVAVKAKSVQGKFEFNIHKGKKHVGTLWVDSSGIIWKDSRMWKGKRILWHRLERVAQATGYKKKV